MITTQTSVDDEPGQFDSDEWDLKLSKVIAVVPSEDARVRASPLQPLRTLLALIEPWTADWAEIHSPCMGLNPNELMLLQLLNGIWGNNSRAHRALGFVRASDLRKALDGATVSIDCALMRRLDAVWAEKIILLKDDFSMTLSDEARQRVSGRFDLARSVFERGVRATSEDFGQGNTSRIYEWLGGDREIPSGYLQDNSDVLPPLTKKALKEHDRNKRLVNASEIIKLAREKQLPMKAFARKADVSYTQMLRLEREELLATKDEARRLESAVRALGKLAAA